LVKVSSLKLMPNFDLFSEPVTWNRVGLRIRPVKFTFPNSGGCALPANSTCPLLAIVPLISVLNKPKLTSDAVLNVRRAASENLPRIGICEKSQIVETSVLRTGISGPGVLPWKELWTIC
jgi:hypothetical protein